MMGLALLTGSRVYGTPNESSDIDMVVLLSPADTERLVAMADQGNDYGPNQQAFRFGNLNIIPVSTPLAMEIWEEGTLKLRAEAPVTRERAVEVHSAMRKAAGLPA